MIKLLAIASAGAVLPWSRARAAFQFLGQGPESRVTLAGVRKGLTGKVSIIVINPLHQSDCFNRLGVLGVHHDLTLLEGAS